MSSKSPTRRRRRSARHGDRACRPDRRPAPPARDRSPQHRSLHGRESATCSHPRPDRHRSPWPSCESDRTAMLLSSCRFSPRCQRRQAHRIGGWPVAAPDDMQVRTQQDHCSALHGAHPFLVQMQHVERCTQRGMPPPAAPHRSPHAGRAAYSRRPARPASHARPSATYAGSARRGLACGT